MLESLKVAGETATVRVAVLDASVPSEREDWLELWERWPAREIMAHPDYVRLFARPGDRTLCVSMRTEAGGVLYPLIARPLASEPWGATEGKEWDLTTPYGYGGPFAWNVRGREAEAYWAGFDAWAAAQPVLTSFARLSLFGADLLPFRGTMVSRGVNVVRSLDLGERELWKDYASKVRQNVDRARENGLRVEFDPSARRLDEFLAVYTSTMERRNALSQYFFPRSFFEAIARDLAGRFVFVYVRSGSKTVSCELILFSATRAYSFLGGTFAQAFSLRPNDLLKHEAILWCRARGLKELVLGGSYREGDNLLRYKQAFAPDGGRAFFLGQRTYDASASGRAVALRREWERSQGREWDPVPGFFPSYRS